MTIRAEAIARFRADCEALTVGPPEAPDPHSLGVAVSGGPDSLALLLLAHAAFPGRVEAATVDHRLRPEAADEAAGVAAICRGLGVPHRILTLQWPDPPGSNIQMRAREGRYHLLGGWALDRGLRFLATGHHADDQAETILMRLNRGAGVSGLAGARARRLLVAHPQTDAVVTLIRPLLDWRRRELGTICEDAAIAPIDDPTNADPHYDRTRVRAFLADADWLDPTRLATSAANLADAEEALAWCAEHILGDRQTIHDDGSITLDPTGLPRELQRRLLIEGLSHFTGCANSPGPKVARLLGALRAGQSGMLADVKATPGPTWRLAWAPPRRS